MYEWDLVNIFYFLLRVIFVYAPMHFWYFYLSLLIVGIILVKSSKNKFSYGLGIFSIMFIVFSYVYSIVFWIKL
ncbi:hypothetical protein GA0061081_11053 [Gilliamella bombicola]|uniref:Uncharacterized protein n=1 Tax=Gilliamella bombicola TaxID=1798182 RepID=A0A1C4CRM2_9GAMM|nr:hypothetical protein GA0061081_11053 [Gilliamella bombicola]